MKNTTSEEFIEYASICEDVHNLLKLTGIRGLKQNNTVGAIFLVMYDILDCIIETDENFIPALAGLTKLLSMLHKTENQESRYNALQIAINELYKENNK